MILPFCCRTMLTHSLILDTDKVDVVVLNNAPIELAYAVVAQGQPLHQVSVEARVEYLGINVSTINNDASDNRFYGNVGRFPDQRHPCPIVTIPQARPQCSQAILDD